MKRRTPRLLCALLTLALLLTLAPLPIARAADETPKLIALTFDDGPSPQTGRLLDELEQRGAVATFFMCGKNGTYGLYRYSALVERMLALGCEPANHSNSHAKFTALGGAQIRGEISAVESYLYRQAGAEYTEVVRIPYGENSETIRKNVNRPMIRWSIDPLDWKYRNANTVHQNIVNKAYDGAIILVHDLYATSVDGALRAIDTLREQGYEFVTVSELFRRRGIELQANHVYFAAPNEGTTLPAYAAPEIAVAADEAAGVINVTFSAQNDGLTLRYTTDGSAPTLKSAFYTEPLALKADTRLRVAGFDRFATRTPIAERTVTVRAAAPRIERWADGLLTLSCATQGATICYTTDGSDPAADGIVYTEPFAPGETVRATARAEGMLPGGPLEAVRVADTFFRDVPADAAYLDALNDVVARGLMSGEASWTFSPQRPMTRAAMVTTLQRLAAEAAPEGATQFTDVPENAWFAESVRWAVDAGVVYGMTATTFAPDGPLTREQAAALLQRFAAHADIPASEPESGNALDWCAANGIPLGLGDGPFAPTEPVTRAELAVMLSALCALTD